MSFLFVDGSLYMTVMMNPIYLILYYLMKESKVLTIAVCASTCVERIKAGQHDACERS